MFDYSRIRLCFKYGMYLIMIIGNTYAYALNDSQRTQAAQSVDISEINAFSNSMDNLYKEYQYIKLKNDILKAQLEQAQMEQKIKEIKSAKLNEPRENYKAELARNNAYPQNTEQPNKGSNNNHNYSSSEEHKSDNSLADLKLIAIYGISDNLKVTFTLNNQYISVQEGDLVNDEWILFKINSSSVVLKNITDHKLKIIYLYANG